MQTNPSNHTHPTPRKNAATPLALAAIFAALVFVATYSFVFSIPATSGYFNFGEITIYVAALLFGPLVGALSGGIGSALSDALVAAQFAPGTFAIKTLEGAIVGVLNQKLQRHIQSATLCATIAIIAGGAEMVVGYFIYEQLVLGYPFALALAEVPFNIVQMAVGLVIAIPIMHAVLRVFPQLKSLTASSVQRNLP
jgi:uncharacterized membrane protein